MPKLSVRILIKLGAKKPPQLLILSLLQEIQKAIDSQKQTLEQVMDKLRIKYSEIYTIVPVEIETHLEDCKQTLQDLEEKVKSHVYLFGSSE